MPNAKSLAQRTKHRIGSQNPTRENRQGGADWKERTSVAHQASRTKPRFRDLDHHNHSWGAPREREQPPIRGSVIQPSPPVFPRAIRLCGVFISCLLSHTISHYTDPIAHQWRLLMLTQDCRKMFSINIDKRISTIFQHYRPAKQRPAWQKKADRRLGRHGTRPVWRA